MFILYVEDNYADRLFVRRGLGAMGHQVMELVITVNRMPDLILMDINLPGMDGLETTSQLKEISYKIIRKGCVVNIATLYCHMILASHPGAKSHAP